MTNPFHKDVGEGSHLGRPANASRGLMAPSWCGDMTELMTGSNKELVLKLGLRETQTLLVDFETK
ncbi:hypothetical protein ACLOJK_034368 [Asimina triloba]